jgi:hypothetical protein
MTNNKTILVLAIAAAFVAGIGFAPLQLQQAGMSKSQ